MKKKILTGLTGVAAAVALAGVASTASAMAPPYAVCTFKGETVLNAGVQTKCWLTLTAKVNCAGDVEIVAAGPVAGEASCPFLFVGNFPWTTNAADIIAGTASINTDGSGSGLQSVMDVTGTPVAGGMLTGSIGPSPSVAATCASGSTVQVPTSVPVSATFSMTGATFTATGLKNLGCVF